MGPAQEVWLPAAGLRTQIRIICYIPGISGVFLQCSGKGEQGSVLRVANRSFFDVMPGGSRER